MLVSKTQTSPSTVDNIAINPNDGTLKTSLILSLTIDYHLLNYVCERGKLIRSSVMICTRIVPLAFSLWTVMTAGCVAFISLFISLHSKYSRKENYDRYGSPFLGLAVYRYYLRPRLHMYDDTKVPWHRQKHQVTHHQSYLRHYQV